MTVFRSLALVLLLFPSGTLAADPAGWPTWVSLEVPTSRETASVALLEGGGITVLAWGNTLVDVSDFDGVELRPVASLESALTTWDPRWDPWLRGMKPVFRPRDAVSRLWVEASHGDAARRLLGGQLSPGGTVVPGARRVTGWLILSFSALYFVLRLLAQASSSSLGLFRAWRWLPLTMALLAAGFLMTGRWAAPQTPPPAPASWLHHLWFQQAWPYGASWGDWKPGTAWSYRTYEHQEGRIVEVKTALAAPGQAWAVQAYSTLNPHHAARLFPRENP